MHTCYWPESQVPRAERGSRGRGGCPGLVSSAYHASLLRQWPWAIQTQIMFEDLSLSMLGRSKVIASYCLEGLQMSVLTSLWFSLSFPHGLQIAASAPNMTYACKSEGKKNKKDHDYLPYQQKFFQSQVQHLFLWELTFPHMLVLTITLPPSHGSCESRIDPGWLIRVS